MTGLGTGDLELALGFARQAHATDGLQAFRHELVPALRGLVACETLGYNEIDLQRGAAVAITDAPLLDGWEARFLELAGQHPLLVAHRRGDLRPALLSDFLTERRLHRLELYQDVYRPIGIEDQIAFGLTGGPTIVAIVLSRSRRTFTERDRRLVELVRPHMVLAFDRALERERTRELIDALDTCLEERHVAVIQIDRRDRPVHCPRAAVELLEAYLGELPRDDRVLPPAIRDWLERLRADRSQPAEHSRRELTVCGARGRLRIYLRAAGAVPEWRTVILEEQRARPPDIDALRSLGLTRRQAQVLRLLACGKNSRQTARELQISTATVEKHIEHIRETLGVSSRAAAIARAYACGRQRAQSVLVGATLRPDALGSPAFAP